MYLIITVGQVAVLTWLASFVQILHSMSELKKKEKDNQTKPKTQKWKTLWRNLKSSAPDGQGVMSPRKQGQGGHDHKESHRSLLSRVKKAKECFSNRIYLQMSFLLHVTNLYGIFLNNMYIQ